MDYKQLLNHIREKQFSPIYILHGEEPYYIDQLVNAFEKNVLEEDEKDFNQTIFYGKDTDLIALIEILKSYPLMAEKRLIIIKEAQDFKLLEELTTYLQNPIPSTIFVIAHKYKTIDARKTLLKSASQHGVIFKSEKIKDYKLASWIEAYIGSKGYTFASKVPLLLSDAIGNDLIRITNELNKLSIVLEKGTEITAAHIEENIGISKDYNIFELTNAIAARNTLKALKIVAYFESNPKAGKLVVVIPIVFKYFAQIMRIHFFSNKSPAFVAATLKVHPFVAQELVASKNNYTSKKIAENIEILYQYDLKCKGVDSTNNAEFELMKEMVIQLIL